MIPQVGVLLEILLFFTFCEQFVYKMARSLKHGHALVLFLLPLSLPQRSHA